DNITLSFDSSEPIQIPSITLADNDSLTVHDTSSNQDGTSWKVVYTVTSGETERDTSFSIDFKDIAGNEGVSKDQTVIDNTIQIDTKTPTLTMVNLSSSNTDDSFAKKDDLVTLSFISSENLQKAIVSFAGQRKTLLGESKNWNTTYSVQSGDDYRLGSPSELDSLILWVDANNVDGQLNTTLQRDDFVEQWHDLSGNENHLSQSISSEKPAFRLDENNRPKIDFDQSHLLGPVLSSLRTGSEHTTFVVFNVDSISTFSDTIYANDAILQSSIGYTGLLLQGGKIHYYNWPSSAYYASKTVNLGQTNVVAFDWENNTQTLTLNGFESETVSSGATENLTGILKVGRSYDKYDTPYDGSISEILIFKQKLTPIEMVLVHNYLAEK
ncbi:MAG: LamG-like jellyroll fold domain-containing protein, partial [SAR324 cluster bacterium]|nr:LamG-like jellyroll fold domain-containing protein [SAR324 cluster bacterium]